MSEKVVAVLCSPTFQGLIALIIGGLLVQAQRIAGLDGEMKATLTAAATAALGFGAVKLGTIGTQKKVEGLVDGQERVEAKVDHARVALAENTVITAQAADAATEAAVKAETAVDAARRMS